MTDRGEPERTYRDQLRRWVPALAGSKATTDVSEALAPGSSFIGLKLFAEGNLSKRREKLRTQLEFVAEAFDDIEDLVSAYIRTIPAPAYETADGEGFLSWLEREGGPTPGQRDYVACQRGRLAVEAAARSNRRGHLRFQELWKSSRERLADVDNIALQQIHLNPIRAWSQFTTEALVDDNAILPADVLFFAAGAEIRTAILEPDGEALVEELARSGSSTVDEWAARSHPGDREGLVAFCRDLTEMGLVAFE